VKGSHICKPEWPTTVHNLEKPVRTPIRENVTTCCSSQSRGSAIFESSDPTELIYWGLKVDKSSLWHITIRTSYDFPVPTEKNILIGRKLPLVIQQPSENLEPNRNPFTININGDFKFRPQIVILAKQNL